MVRKFYVTLKRNGIQSDFYWIHMISVLQGISYGLCSIPDNTTCWDIDYYGDAATLMIECTKEHFDTFLESVEGMFPIEYSYKEES